MSQSELDALLERMPKIAEAVEKFSSKAIQAEAFRSLIRAFSADLVDAEDIDQDDTGDENNSDTPTPAKKTAAKKTAAKKAAGSKTTFSIDKSLDLVGGGKPPFKEFAGQKAPTNVLEKCLVSVYWLSRIRKPEAAATIDQVYSCFKHMEWKVPSDLANTLAQAGSKNGWIDSKKRDDLKVPIHGENFIEHEMPKKVAGSS